jgi:hypothetical protein
MLPFLVACIIFALIGTGVRGVIRPLSWATLGLATLIASYNGLPNFFNSTISSTDSPASADPNNFPAPRPNTGPVANQGWYAITPRIDPLVASDTRFTAEPAPPEEDSATLERRILQEGPITQSPPASSPSPTSTTVPPVTPQAQPTPPYPDQVVQNPQTTTSPGTIRGLW